MKAGFVFLTLAYVLSQFYRAFLAVLTPVLSSDLGMTGADLSTASGMWFITFAVMQIPIGWAFDKAGPRWTASILLAIGGGGGSALFAMAQTPLHVQAAMALIGVGCAPVLMASYYIFARLYSPAIFGTLAGVLIGVGTAGNLAGSIPLAKAVEAMGWRPSLWAMFAVTVIVAAGVALFVRNPPKIEVGESTKGSLLDLLKIPQLWLIIPLLIVNYAPAAAIRGLWAGPYLRDEFGMDASGIGTITFWMAVAMMIGSFAYGPMDRVFGTRKWVVFGGNFLGMLCLFGLWAFSGNAVITSAILLFGVGLFGLSFPQIMAHGRSFIPPHLVGRGVTLLNLFSIGGVALSQMASGKIYTSTDASYPMLFLFFAVLLLIGLAVYAFSEDRIN